MCSIVSRLFDTGSRRGCKILRTRNRQNLLNRVPTFKPHQGVYEQVKRLLVVGCDELKAAVKCVKHSVYEKGVDSFIIVSSDSDYWGLISSLPRARFLVMAEREKCGADMKNAMMNSGIFYCYIEDFYSGNTDDMKTGALFRELHRYLDSAVHFNVNNMLDAALEATRINMTSVERKQFYDRHIKQMKLEIDENGDVSIELKR